jgi:hypothetical protein
VLGFGSGVVIHALAEGINPSPVVVSPLGRA